MIYSHPAHLNGLVTEADKATLSEIQKEYGESTTAFKFDNKFQNLVLSYDAESDEYGGRVWGVDTTGTKLLLFDQFKHGYNGVMELNEEDDISTTKTIDFFEATDVVIAFQYSGDEEEYLEDGTSKLEQDYFGWVSIYKQADNQLEEIISFECA
jgi:hypothetical protein